MWKDLTQGLLAALAKISGAFTELPQLPKACTLLGEGKPCSVGPRSHVEAHSDMKACCDMPNKPRAQPRLIPGEETGSTLGLVPPLQTGPGHSLVLQQGA